MDMVTSLAAYAMNMSAMKFQQDYSIALTKKVMDGEEVAMQELLDMMPQYSDGRLLDVYA